MKNVPTNLSNLKSKVDKLDVNDVFKKDVYNTKIKNIEDKTPDITNLATYATVNAKINEVKGKIPSITNLATTALTAVENEIPNVCDIVKKVTITQKLMKLKINLLLIMIMINILLLKILIS